MEDVRIGREATGYEDVRTVDATVRQLVAADPNRIALVIACPVTDDVVLGFSPAVTATAGMRLPKGGSPFKLHIGHDGGMVRNGIWAVTAAGSEPIAVWSAVLGRQ